MTASRAADATQRMLRDAEDVLIEIAYETVELLRAALAAVLGTDEADEHGLSRRTA